MAARTSSRRRSQRARRRNTASDFGARFWVAIPAAAYAIAIIYLGDAVFAAGVLLLGFICLHELFRLYDRVHPVRLAGFLALIGLAAAAHFGEVQQVLLATVAVFPLVFLIALILPEQTQSRLTPAMSITFLGVFWIGLALAHGILLRELPHGDGIIVDILVGTFLGDTAAYLGGRTFGTRPLAPRISPNKTVEGLLFGVGGAILAVWCAGLYQDWLGGWDAHPARRRRRGRGADRGPVRVQDQARRGHEGHGHAVRRPRRRPRPARRRIVHVGRRVLPVGAAPMTSGDQTQHVETGPDDRSRDERKRDRQMMELLNELRVALPGVQILFAFLLTVPFSVRFDLLTAFQRDTYYFTLMATLLSTACLIAPSAAHRMRFHKGERPWIVESAHRMMIGGLAFLACALTGSVLLITDLMFDGARVWIYTGVVAALLIGLWFVRPLLRELR